MLKWTNGDEAFEASDVGELAEKLSHAGVLDDGEPWVLLRKGTDGVAFNDECESLLVLWYEEV